jgi:tripartite-type tricarboxylate transporter receptor subunit TctC
MFRSLSALVLCAVMLDPAHAQNYPTAPIRLIVPFPPGGGTDTVSRIVGQALAKSTGWNVVVENKAGANGTIGVADVARAKPDGYTIVMAQSDNMIIAPLVQKNMPFDPLNDLAPVAQVANSSFLLMGAANSKYKDLNGMIKAAKAQPKSVTYGTPGHGTLPQLAVVLLEQAGDFHFTEVPYKGAAPAITDVLGGQIDMASLSVASGLPQVKAGNLKGLAVTSSQRSPVLPDVPTVAELGYKGFEAVGFLGILAPKGTPAAIITRLNAEIVKVLQQSDLKKQLVDQGSEAHPSTPVEFGTLIKSETAKWKVIADKAGIKPE